MRTTFLNYPVSNFTKNEIFLELANMINSGGVHFVTVMNANKMYLYDKNEKCKKSVDESSLILPENAINIGMKWLKTPLKEWDVGGVVIAREILLNTKHKVFLLGAKEEILQEIIRNDKYNSNIVGVRNGYFTNREIPEISSIINNSDADIILLGLGSPKQEMIMQVLKTKLKRGILMGVGGTFDVLAGKKKDAPRWTKRGLEWLYRALQDPKKFKRYFIVNLYFIKKYILFRLKRNS